MKYPKNMIDFLNDFSTEEQCITALEDIRWDGKCTKCGSAKYWRHGTRRTRICASCRTHLSVTADTVLHRLRIPMRALFLIAWFMVTSKQWVSSEELSLLLWISPTTAWLWSQKFRKIMVLQDREKLRWDVEVDEIFIGWVQSWKRGRWAEWKEKVVIAVEINMKTPNKKWFFRWMGRIRMKVIPNCSEKTLTTFIQENIETWSTLYTDGWKGYNSLNKIGYTHILQTDTVQIEEGVWVHTVEVTPNVHIIASLLKRWMLGTHQKYMVQNDYLQDYLEEYTFRFNRRKSSDRWKLFRTLLEQVISQKPTTKSTIQKHLHRNTE